MSGKYRHLLVLPQLRDKKRKLSHGHSMMMMMQEGRLAKNLSPRLDSKIA